MVIYFTGINVPRSRFLPVKTTSDLLIIMSNLYTLHSGSLKMNPTRNFLTVPLVKLGNSFKKVCFKIRIFQQIKLCLLILKTAKC